LILNLKIIALIEPNVVGLMQQGASRRRSSIIKRISY